MTARATEAPASDLAAPPGASAASCWTFAVSCWERPGVKALCLALQDAHRQSVALLLWGLWTTRPGVAGEPDLAAAARLARDWEDRILAPLRAARGRLGTLAWPPGADPAPLRRQLLACELTAEEALLGALEALPAATAAPGLPCPAATDAVRRLIALTAHWDPPAPAALLESLAAALAD